MTTRPKRPASRSGGLGLLALLVVVLAGQVGMAQTVRIGDFHVDDTGRITFTIVGPGGDYVVQSATTTPYGQDWTLFCRARSDGAGPEITTWIEEGVPKKYFRIQVFPAPDPLHLNGEFAREVESGIAFANLQAAFGLAFTEAEAVLPAVTELGWAERHARLYAATVAALSQLATDVHDSFTPGTEPTAAEIVAALALDLASGDLDGRDSAGQRVGIGSTGIFLPLYADQDFLDAVASIQAAMPPLHNIVFMAIGGGTFTAGVPGDWCDFYWDSADWQ